MRVPTILAALILALGLAAPAAASGGDQELELSDIMHFAGDFAPAHWADLNGAALPAGQFCALFSLLGTTYGGDVTGSWATTPGSRQHPATTSWVYSGTFNLPKLPDPTPTQPRAMMCMEGYYPQGWQVPDVGAAGIIRLMPFTGRYGMPANWVPCHGQAVARENAPQLYDLVKDTFGPVEDPVLQADEAFNVPKLPDAIPDTLVWAICTAGTATPNGYLGEIRRWPAAAPVPADWAPCDGRNMRIDRNQALFAIVGAKYGSDNRTYFQLPNLPDEAGVRWIVCTMGIFPSRY